RLRAAGRAARIRPFRSTQPVRRVPDDHSPVSGVYGTVPSESGPVSLAGAWRDRAHGGGHWPEPVARRVARRGGRGRVAVAGMEAVHAALAGPGRGGRRAHAGAPPDRT